MNTQPEALRLAYLLEVSSDNPTLINVDKRCAAELRRLHEVNQKLIGENSKLWGWYHDAEQKIAVLERKAKAGEQP